MSKLSWTTKLMGLITLVLGALLLFQVFYVIPYLRNREVERTQAHQEEIAHNIALLLDTKLEQGEKDLTQMAKRAEFRNMDLVNQRQAMIWYRELIRQFSSLFALDAEGWFVSGIAKDLTVYQTQSYADADFFAVPFEQGQVHLSSPRSYFEGTFVGASVSVPIESDTGERVGVLIGGVWLNELMEYVKDYSLGEGTVAYAVDSEGTLFAHSGMDLFALEEGPLSLDFSDRLLVQAIMDGEMGGSREHDREGTPYFGSYVTLESSGWGIVVETPMSAILAESSVLAGRLLTVNIALFAIALGVALVFTRQITAEQRRAEESLRLLSTAVETSVDAISVASPVDGKLLFCNAAFLKQWKVKGDYHRLSYPECFDVVPSVLEEAAKATVEGGWSGELTAKAMDGQTFPVLTTASPVVDEEGRIFGMLGVFKDITERKQAEDALRESEERLGDFMESATDSFIILDSELKYVEVNKAAERMFSWLGLTKEDVIGKNILEVIPMIKETGRYEKYKEVLSTGRPFTVDDLVPHPEFGDIHLAMKVFKMGEDLGMITTDITERKRAEEALAQRVEELERFHRLTVGRELRMIELKRQINELSEQLGKEAPYDLSLLE